MPSYGPDHFPGDGRIWRRSSTPYHSGKDGLLKIAVIILLLLGLRNAKESQDMMAAIARKNKGSKHCKKCGPFITHRIPAPAAASVQPPQEACLCGPYNPHLVLLSTWQ